MLSLTFFSSNVDAEFRQYEHLMFPSKTIHTDGIRAGVMVSVGCTTINIICSTDVFIRHRSVSAKSAAV